MFDFYFQSGDFGSSTGTSFWGGFWEFVKYLSPFIVLFISLRIQKIREIDKINKEKKDLYDLFKLLLNDIVINIPSQLALIRTKINMTHDKKLDINKLLLAMPDNYERITEKISVENLYKSYLYAHGSEGKSKEIFKNILVLLDYVKRNFISLRELNDYHNKNLKDFIDHYRGIVEKTYARCIEIDFEVDSKPNATEDEKLLRQHIIRIQEESMKLKKVQILDMQEKFLTPLKDAIVSNKNLKTEYSAYLINQYREGLNILNHEIRDSAEYIDGYEKLYSAIYMSLFKLIEFSSRKRKELPKKGGFHKFFHKLDEY